MKPTDAEGNAFMNGDTVEVTLSPDRKHYGTVVRLTRDGKVKVKFTSFSGLGTRDVEPSQCRIEYPGF